MGDWTFEDVTPQTGLEQDNTRFSFAASWEDYDQDGDLDLYLANDFGRNCLYQNQGATNGKLPFFVNIAGPLGVEDSAAGMSTNWGDFNRDSWIATRNLLLAERSRKPWTGFTHGGEKGLFR